ncbi:MAG: hypothetical protein DHS20C15_15620 [Planctomycetota bacterium]|nr:MAG: hypothetical protein DHS20C15_15620 [Planctomycetota bacterium]
MMILASIQGSLDDLLRLGGWLDQPMHFWLWATLLLLIAEILTAGFLLGAIAVSTLLTAGGAWLGLTAEWQMAFFALSSIASLLWLRPVFVSLLSPDESPTNVDALIGRSGTVVAQVPANGIGRVRLNNEEWRATASSTLQVGAPVRVDAVEGNTVRVSAA